MTVRATTTGARHREQSQPDRGRLMTRLPDEQRQNPRIAAVPRAKPDRSASHPLLVNVSADGACLWLADPPPAQQFLALRFKCKGQDRVLKSRLIWSQSCEAMPNRNNLPNGKGWLAGIHFDEAGTNIRIDGIPHDILHTGHAAVSFHDHDDVPDTRQLERDAEQRRSERPVLDEGAITTLKSAAKDLAPIFAQHFSDVRLVCTRDRFELSASFRSPTREIALQAPEPAQPAIETRQKSSDWTKPSVELPSHMAAPRTAPTSNWPGREFIVLVAVAVAILSVFYFAVLHDSGEEAQDSGPVVALEISPPWAQGLGLYSKVVEGWVQVKRTHRLSDETVRSMILILQENEKYPSGHDLHDLSKHPTQAGRALSLLAAAQAQSATTLDIAPVKDDLESHLMAGARFPDEPPGGRYSSLQRELYHNLVVLGVVELLYRRQDESAVQKILAALPQGNLKQHTK